jgi:CRISPR/Cas system CSM-associated protein Csm3 (group 7 of RAMP superfamily)
MMQIEYKIQFYSDWLCGSGLSSGADLDLLVVKDNNKLPYIPGKTIKGLLLEAMKDINDFSTPEAKVDLEVLFGFEPGQQKEKKNGEKKKNEESQGCLFFTNATLDYELGKAIIDNNLQDYLYYSVASTAINENGIANEHSLRSMQITVPCKLTGKILDIPEGSESCLEKGLKYIKRIGQNRNRGLGRCSFNI